MTLQAAINAAMAADANYTAALAAAGMSRWEKPKGGTPQAVTDAFNAKVKADAEMHAAFEESRQ